MLRSSNIIGCGDVFILPGNNKTKAHWFSLFSPCSDQRVTGRRRASISHTGHVPKAPPTTPTRHSDINICTIFRKTIHIEFARVETVHSMSSFFPSSVEPLVPLLSLLEDDGSDHGAHDDPQQGAQQQQEDLPAGERRAAEVSGRIIYVVCTQRRIRQQACDLKEQDVA